MADELKVKISSDNSGLDSGLSDAKNSVGSAASDINNSLASIRQSVVTTIAAFIGFEQIKSTIETAINFDSLSMSINAATGSAENGAKAMEFVRNTAESLGLNLQATAESYKTIAAASMGTALEGKKTRDIFLAISEASAVMGLSSENTKGALIALGQMISKGTVQSEELKGQLGERIPGAMQIAAKAMGVTTAELQKMLDTGKVMSDEFLPKFAQALHDRFAKDVPEAAESSRASMERFHNSITELKVALAESGILEFAELLARGWSYMAGVVTIAVKGLASNVVEAWAQIYANWNEVVIGGILRTSNRLNSILPNALKIDTSGLASSYAEGKTYADHVRKIADDLDKSANESAQKLKQLIDRNNGLGSSLKLEGNYELGGSGAGLTAAQKKAAEKAKADAEKLANDIRMINDQTVAMKLEGLDREAANAKTTYDRERALHKESKEYQEAVERKYQATLESIDKKRLETLNANNQKIADEQLAIAQSNADAIKQIEMVKVQDAIDALNYKKSYETISKEEELKETQRIESMKYEIEHKALEDKIALLQQGTIEFAKANNDILILETKHAQQMAVIDKKIAAESKSAWDNFSTSAENALGSAIGGMINFTSSFKSAFVGMIKTLLTEFTSFIGKKVAAWAFGEQAMTAATVSGNIARVASNAWANITSLAMTVATAIKTIAVYAWQAAAAAYTSVSAIPVVGPFLAPAMAAGAVVAVTSMIGNIASAEGGYDIPSGVNPMTQLHQNEMVLPAHIAQPLRENLAGGGIGGGTNITIHAVDAKSVKQLFEDHGSALVSSLKKQGRNFNA